MCVHGIFPSALLLLLAVKTAVVVSVWLIFIRKSLEKLSFQEY